MLNHNKSYILGLFTGAGKIDKDSFLIELPFKKWGMEPTKMNVIAIDILQRIAGLFNSEYGLKVTYEIGNNRWFIKPIDNQDFTKIRDDLKHLNLPNSGFLLNTADLNIAKSELKGINAESFLSGFFDTRASITLSHRRFNDDAPVVSIEIPGSTKNFKLVVQLCSWLTDLGSTTDQILYNHPNQHAKADPYYKGWKKGFKIRFLVQSFLATHSFALQAKAIDATKIKKKQKKEEQYSCPLRKIRQPSPLTVHNEIDSVSLPIEVRNKLYFHYFHYCASLGCKYAPTEEVKRVVLEKKSLISFFPRLSKGTTKEISQHFNHITETYFSDYDIVKKSQTVNDLLSENSIYLTYYGIEQALAFLTTEKLNGKRHSGPMEEILTQNTKTILMLHSFENTDDEPIMIINSANDRAIICSNIASRINQKLIKTQTKTKGLDIELLR
ncbi:hypothetical protein [Maribacter sp. 2307ULW6-5]|uniref:hypothetical protein n=1 Tax=Maribacter sp. 2307ULW6-5 TaxID=3386275 RepID=UPI0039BD0F82